MKLYILASLLMAAQVMSSPRPQGWAPPPTGWVPPPTGWTAVPDPATPDGLVIAAGETLIGEDLAVDNTLGDYVSLSVDDAVGLDATVALSTNLEPDAYLGAEVGEAGIPLAAESAEGPGVYISNYGYDTGTYNLTDVVNTNLTAAPYATASGSVGTIAASSWVQFTDGINVAPNAGSGSGWGWKQDEGVKQN